MVSLMPRPVFLYTIYRKLGVGPRDSLDDVLKRKLCCPCQEPNPGSPARSPLLYRPNSLMFIVLTVTAVSNVFCGLNPV